MYTAILLDGTKEPVSIRLNPKDGRPASVSWSGAADKPAKHFNFVRSLVRDKGEPAEREVMIFRRVGLRAEAEVPGLVVDSRRLTVAEQGERMADEFLYPERYAEAGMAAAV
jgi:hypothetical protein